MSEHDDGAVWLQRRFADLLHDVRERHGEREALVDGERRLTYAQLVARVHAFARGLLDAGIGHGDRVALWMSDSTEWMIARWAVPSIGAILVPVNTRFRAADVRYVLEQSETQCLIFERGAQGVSYVDILRQIAGDLDASKPHAWRLDALPALRTVIGVSAAENADGTAHDTLAAFPSGVTPFEAIEARGAQRLADGALEHAFDAVASTDVAQILYTSGTTSFPKGAMVCHGPLLRNNYSTLARMKLTQADRYLSSVPLFSATGTGYTLSMTLAGGAIVLMKRFAPRDFCATVERERITLSFFVDAIVRDLKAFDDRSRYDLSSLRTGTGAPLSSDAFLFASHELGIRQLIGVFGMSETTNAIARCDCSEPLDIRSSTNGRAVPGATLEIVDLDTGETVPPNTIGELRVSGFMLMQGYYRMPEETAQAFDDAGRLRTGDLGELTESGHFIYRGRVKDMIKPGGFNVSTQEIEAFLRTFDGVQEAAVVGVPDARLGEVGYAFLQTHGNRPLDTQALLAYCRVHIASFKVPRHIEFVTDWPRTGSEKIRKTELRVRATASLAARSQLIPPPASLHGQEDGDA
ncbi:AMP-binding protein [Caballeronia sp. LZ035]|uniref:class I adenylate-forming enzyme family protein n=1 Tax=Caballeronia sp. LZ035 TaxID=3038568 RepID=UPI00285710DE|nr:AMP-binding protein [Caballeronia sp. LZ035]MDR5760609.1 AMP-binding protein [Caballeronia sp. LZ035]